MSTTVPAGLSIGEVVATTAVKLTDLAVVRSCEDGRTGPQSLAGGAAGIALLHLERAVSGHGTEAVAHRWIRAAATGPVNTGPHTNLFAGAPALALLLHTAATTLGGYQRASTALDEQTTAITRSRLAAAHARLDAGVSLTMREFDLIHGLTGLGVYHLRRHPDHPITHDVLSYLTRLTAPVKDRTARPPWWLDAGLGGTPDPTRFPRGHGNLGIAHGMSAVTALLALAVLTGQHPPATPDSLVQLCAWFDHHRQTDTTTGTSWWPAYVTDDLTPPRHRPSWCYGTAGTARAQQLAGLALGDTARQRRAETAMVHALDDPRQRDMLPEPGLCHGKAGLLQAAWRTATTSTDQQVVAQLTAAIPDLANALARQLTTSSSGSPELMDGFAGAALALHTADTGACHTTWDAFLLLA